ncbi:hypothetical protein TRAPUB_3998 [Trametes pubescens]|uniref:Uncharacterized protein n=1 Tax=Trametes pubescens TaxID=154538 RepID=A0A1M2VCA7_TRAPU|nr:hypothetical protein TRAPUB_3998 [Trametes pubescens]
MCARGDRPHLHVTKLGAWPSENDFPVRVWHPYVRSIHDTDRNTTFPSGVLLPRNDPAVEETGDAAIGIAVPGLILLCAGATLLYLLVRESKRKKAGESPPSRGFLARLLRRSSPTGVVSISSAPVTESLVLRRLNTYRFVAAPPQKRASPPLLDAGSVEEEEVVREEQAEESTLHRRYPPSHLSRFSDDPFSDANTPDSAGISPPPSAFLRSRLTLSDAGESLHWDSASSSHGNPFIDSGASVERASLPASASAPSFIGSTASSAHDAAPTESTPPTPRSMSMSDDFGYLSDATMSTLPPSYRTNRANVPRVPHLPPPSSQTSTTHDTITAPPSAFTTRSRRRSIMHGPRPPSGARQQAGAGVEQASTIRDEATGDDETSGCGGPSRRARHGEQQAPRRSMDGGVRLEGGPLEIGGEGRALMAGNAELDPPPMYKGPRVPGEKERFAME